MRLAATVSLRHGATCARTMWHLSQLSPRGAAVPLCLSVGRVRAPEQRTSGCGAQQSLCARGLCHLRLAHLPSLSISMKNRSFHSLDLSSCQSQCHDAGGPIGMTYKDRLKKSLKSIAQPLFSNRSFQKDLLDPWCLSILRPIREHAAARKWMHHYSSSAMGATMIGY